MKIARFLPVVLLGACGAALGQDGNFRLNSVSSGVTVQVTGDFPQRERLDIPDIRQSIDGVALNATHTVSIGDSVATATVQASSDVGSLRAATQGFAYTEDIAGRSRGAFVSSSAIARWQDTVMLVGGGAPGTLSRLNAQLLLDGSIAASGAGDTTAEVFLTLQGIGLPTPPYQNGGINSFAYAYHGTVPVQRDHPLILFYQPIVTAGVPYTFDISMTVQGTTRVGSLLGTGSRGSRNGAYDASYAHTLTWGGIESVTDVLTGQPIENWSITSASGVNYANAIPEPSGLGLLTSCFAFATVRRRRGRW